MKPQRHESGQMMVLLAIELVMIVGFLALAADVGFLFHSERHMQTAADAAATAGALNILDDTSTNPVTVDADTIAAAKAAASANGYTDGQDGVSVIVHTPPDNGYHMSNNYVAVTIAKSDPLYFFRVFTGNNSTTVTARAVAGSPQPAKICMYLGATSGTGLNLKGMATIEGPNGSTGCGVYVNSSSSDAIYNQDSGSTINTAVLETPGGYSKNDTYPTPVTTISGPITEPFSNVQEPTTADCTGTYTESTISPATTQSGVSAVINGVLNNLGSVTCFSASNVTLQNVNLGTGIWLFENGLTLSGNVSVNGGTIFIASGTFNQDNANFSVTAPTSGPYNAIGLWQSASDTNTLDAQFGSSTSSLLDAYIVALGACVYIQDNGGYVEAEGLAAKCLDFNSGTFIIGPNYNTVNAQTTPFRDVSLVE